MSDHPAPDVSVLEQAERSAQALRKQTIGTTVAMVLFALASSAAVLIFGFGSGLGRVIGGTAFVVSAAIALVVVATTAKARSRDFTRRYLTTVGLWAVIYTLFVVSGFTIFAPASSWFWVLAAVLVALPGVWFALGSHSSKLV